MHSILMVAIIALIASAFAIWGVNTYVGSGYRVKGVLPKAEKQHDFHHPKAERGMKRSMACSVCVAVLAWNIAGWVPFAVAGDTSIFVTDSFNLHLGDTSVGEYTSSGATVDASLITGVATADIKVVGDYIYVANDGAIGKYSLSGAPVNTSFITTGLQRPVGIAYSDGKLFVSSYGGGGVGNGFIGEYSLSGAPINTSLITGLSAPDGIAVSGSDLFVTNELTGTVGKYTTSGATVNASLITGLAAPQWVIVTGGNLYVSSFTSGTVGEYTLDGTPINASLISGLNGPTGMAVLNGNLLVMNYNTGTLGEYTPSGATVNAALITGLGFGAEGVAVPVVPEPSSVVLLGVGSIGLLWHALRRRDG